MARWSCLQNILDICPLFRIPFFRTRVTTAAYDMDVRTLAQDVGRVVSDISVIGIPTRPFRTDTTGARLVHWRIHLRWQRTNGQLAAGSVVLDTRTVNEDSPIVEVDAYSRSSLVSAANTQNWMFTYTFVPGSNPTVQALVNLVQANNRHHYQYDGSGSGCLFWCRTILGDFVAAGFLPEGTTARFISDVDAVREVESGKAEYEQRYWIPEDQGMFI